MSSDALTSHGSLVYLGSVGGGGAYTAIGELVDIEFPSMSRKVHEAPRQTSDLINKLLGMLDGGSVKFTVNFVPASASLLHDLLVSDFEDNVRRGYKIATPDGHYVTFTGGITAMPVKAPVDGVLQGDWTVEVLDALDLTNLHS